jgi:2-hydroxymuconate-semialdehyde hydrolase
MNDNPEIGKSLQAAGLTTNYHDLGDGAPVVLVHGSGPGVSAWANWRTVLPALSEHFRVIAPDMAGFGYSERPADGVYSLDRWRAHLLGLFDALGLTRAHLIGNSFGGALCLAFAIAHPERVERLVLMGSVGLRFPLTPGLDQVWGYQPSVAAMRDLMELFAYDHTLVSDELAALRHKASIRPGVQEAYSAMFPAPRQRWVEAMASREEDIAAIGHETLVIHGRDDKVIPLECGQRLNQLIKRSDLHVFGRCGHWAQIERNADFCRLVSHFLAEGLS